MFKSNILSITVINNTTKANNWVAFGYNKGVQNAPGISVSVSESSLEESNRQSASIPFKIESIKVRTQSERQLANPILIQTSDATGKLVQANVTPMDYYEPTTNIQNLVKINNPNITISGQVSLSGIINAGQTMNITITIKKQSGFSNFISGIFKRVENRGIKIKWGLLPE